MKKVWDFLNGNKTIIGMFALIVLQVFEPKIDPELYPNIVAIVISLTGASLGHKLIKKAKGNK